MLHRAISFAFSLALWHFSSFYQLMELTLLIMAAGMGTRYGGLKQFYTFGPNDETLLDYSIYDAIKAGFSKVVFVIRKEIENEFKSTIFKRISSYIPVDYVYQEIDSYIPSNIIQAKRKKPWGTGHAVLVAQNKVKGPFAVINADDFYGRQSYQLIADFLKTNSNPKLYALVAYQLKKTLSAHGWVSRGVCNIDSRGNLQSITEHRKIAQDAENNLIDWQPNGKNIRLTGNEMVSLNLWGFQSNFFDFLNKKFQDFLQTQGQSPEAEFFLTFVVDEAIKENIASVAVLPTAENWFGVTYKDDGQMAREEIQKRIISGDYPTNLWKSINLEAEIRN